ncbi:MAG: DUF6404 family protein [Planctomycetota bacterium]
MDHRAKVEHFKQQLTAAGRNWKADIPQVWRVMWWFGSQIPPPHFMPARQLRKVFGWSTFAGALPIAGVAFWHMRYSPTGIAIASVLAAAGLALLTALVGAHVMQRLARRLDLLPWEHYPHGFARPVERDPENRE